MRRMWGVRVQAMWRLRRLMEVGKLGDVGRRFELRWKGEALVTNKRIVTMT
jgi:hypothetical protein